ncbi:hypothetical protein V7149_19685 [Bacillus sp. JJ1503]|uniref:hypothetical protein n=1 Tax=unclassified Bacillus (in: firmicutes) TaxID=185979 RepID=UPI002FFFC303
MGCNSEEIDLSPSIHVEEKELEIDPEEEVFASTQINAPFPLGAKLSELKEHYDEPTYDDYYSGARLVVFDKEGYFIDELDETVVGYYFATLTLSVFGATVGMTAEEINKVFAESVEPVEDELDSDGYILAYYKNGFKIFFDLEIKNGPTTVLHLVREYDFEKEEKMPTETVSSSSGPSDMEIYEYMKSVFDRETNYGANYIPEVHDQLAGKMASEKFGISSQEAIDIYTKIEIEKAY